MKREPVMRCPAEKGADASRARPPVAVRAAAFAPPLLATGSLRHSLSRSVRPSVLAAGALRVCEQTAGGTGQLGRGGILRLSAAASKVRAAPSATRNLAMSACALLLARCVARTAPCAIPVRSLVLSPSSNGDTRPLTALWCVCCGLRAVHAAGSRGKPIADACQDRCHRKAGRR